MGDLLGYAIVRNLKIAGFQIVNHVAAAIAHGHRGVYQRDVHFDLRLRVLGRQLDCDSRFGRERAGGGLGPCENAGECKEKQQDSQ